MERFGRSGRQPVVAGETGPPVGALWGEVNGAAGRSAVAPRMAPEPVRQPPAAAAAITTIQASLLIIPHLPCSRTSRPAGTVLTAGRANRDSLRPGFGHAIAAAQDFRHGGGVST